MNVRLAIALSIGLATLGTVSVANANGRFPYANQLVVDPKDPKHIVVRSTYGILQTFDGGTKWTWLCEKSVGYGGTFDPAIAVTAADVILAGTFDGLSTSADRGCTFGMTKSVLDANYVIDVAVDPSNPMRAVAMTSTGLGVEGFKVLVAETTDGGKTWSQLFEPLRKDFNSETIEVAASDPKRLYATGVFGTPRQGVLERSDDHGETWTRIVIELNGSKAPYLSGVDPRNADHLYLRLDGESPRDDAGEPTGPADRLMFSNDGGKTWKEIGSTFGDMFGFALSPDGTKVAYGGPKDGIFVASTSDHVFTRVSRVTTRCLTWTSAGLFTCASEYPDDFTVGLSTDDGKTFKPLYHLTNLGLLECPNSTTTGKFCPTEWPKIVETLGIDAGSLPVVDASTPRPDTAADPGTPAPPRERGCNCTSPGSAPRDVAMLGFGLVAVLAIWRRRTR